MPHSFKRIQIRLLLESPAESCRTVGMGFCLVCDSSHYENVVEVVQFMEFGKLTKSYLEVESEPLWRNLLVSWLGITASEVSLGGFRIQLYILIQLLLKRS